MRLFKFPLFLTFVWLHLSQVCFSAPSEPKLTPIINKSLQELKTEDSDELQVIKIKKNSLLFGYQAGHLVDKEEYLSFFTFGVATKFSLDFEKNVLLGINSDFKKSISAFVTAKPKDFFSGLEFLGPFFELGIFHYVPVSHFTGEFININHTKLSLGLDFSIITTHLIYGVDGLSFLFFTSFSF
ncbi:MAG: hypothetical protein L6Q37_04305 [Bdellovibrionaceae bacterium]|nr:hypothetical protein [Pseudobdellovibrionaceae bacterium]NUM57489.1 hypothetical protein [Pseudobdellovibrionaceae bacterium]